MSKKRRNFNYKMQLTASRMARKSNIAAKLFVSYLKRKDKKAGILNQQMDSFIKQYSKFISSLDTDTIREDIWKSIATNLISVNEYFLYRFFEKNHDERIPFVGNTEKRYLCRLVNVNSPWMIFGNKWNTFQKFGKYYHRKCIPISSIQDKEDFLAFCSANTRTIVKIVRGDSGLQVFAVDSANNASTFFADMMEPVLKDGGMFIAEEYIESHPDIKKFNPSSLNTVRIATFVQDGKPRILFAVLRIGRAGKIVDNAASGGMCAPIDLKSGEIPLGASTESMDYFEQHPDTGTQIKGFLIPKWQELVELAKEMALIVPEQKYVSWDMALTENCWVMVEGNSEGDIILPQIAWKKGIRDIVEETLYRNI